MIYGNLENLGDISIYPIAIQTAIKYLRDTDLINTEAGTYELQGKDMYVMISNMDTAQKEDKKPEVHRKYIDVQYLVQGKERIGVAVDTGRNNITDEYDEEKDVMFYENCQNESEIIMTPGAFLVLFPNIVHRPGCNDEQIVNIKKVVIKIHKTLL